MGMQPDDVIEFNFEGVDPAIAGGRVAMPKGEYNLQCLKVRKYFKGDKGGTEQGDPSKPGLEFTFAINNHPTFTGEELKLWHPLAESSYAYLLNTLMCVIPGPNWQQNGIKMPMSTLMQQAAGRPCNGLVEWELTTKDDRKYINNKLQAVKPFDQSIIQPMPTEGNPPTVVNDGPSATSRQAAAGVSPDEVNQFLNQSWPGGSTPATPAAPANTGFDFEPF